MPRRLKRYHQARESALSHLQVLSTPGTARLCLGKEAICDCFREEPRPLRFLCDPIRCYAEHIHLLISEPEGGTLASAVQAIKQSVSRKMMTAEGHSWQARYYDFQCLYAAQTQREVALHSSQSGEARIGGPAGRMAMEQFPSLRNRVTRESSRLNRGGQRQNGNERESCRRFASGPPALGQNQA
jgi:hypothetical protein